MIRWSVHVVVFGALLLLGIPTTGAAVLTVRFGGDTTVSWTTLSGTWTVVDSSLHGENGRMVFPQKLPTDRRVEAVIGNLDGEWVAVIGKYENEKAWVDVRISSTMVAVVVNAMGSLKTWQKYIDVVFPVKVTVAFSGKWVRVHVNEELVLQQEEAFLETLGGLVGLAVQGRANFKQLYASSFKTPVLITPIGQSPGGLVAKVLADRVGLTNAYVERAGPPMLESVGTLVLVVGASTKGLGAAGIVIDDEIARGKALVAKARELGIVIIVMHLEGEARRGGLSDLLIKEFIPQADYVVVRADGNNDGLFTTLCDEHGIPLRIITTTAAGAEVLADLFGLWQR